MNKTVSVIVSRCVARKDTSFPFKETWSSYGECLTNKTFPSVESARDFAEPKRDQGMSVVIRPNYNEPNEGYQYREWRSFNGEPFEEVRFFPHL